MKISRFKVSMISLDRDSLLDIITKGELAKGSELFKLSESLSNLFVKKHAVLTSNGFSAIFLVIKGLGIQGKNILMPAASTCLAIVNAIKASGNTPLFCDLDINTGNMDVECAKELKNERGFDLVVSPNHFGIRSSVHDFQVLGVPVVEDCAQSFLTNAVQNSNADFQVFSFYPTKIINGIDGGAIVSSSQVAMAQIENIASYDHQEKPDKVVRYNFKMNNINAHLALQQLTRVQEISDRYQKIINRYDSIDGQGKFTILRAGSENIYYKYVLNFNGRKEAERMNNYLTSNGIETSKEFMFVGDQISNFPVAKHLIESSFSIPLYESLTDVEVDYVIAHLQSYLTENGNS